DLRLERGGVAHGLDGLEGGAERLDLCGEVVGCHDAQGYPRDPVPGAVSDRPAPRDGARVQCSSRRRTTCPVETLQSAPEGAQGRVRPNISAVARALGVPASGSAPWSSSARTTSAASLKTAPASGDWLRALSRFTSAPRSARPAVRSAWPW